MSTQLSQEEIKAIENYGDRIKTLKDFVTAVRKRPGYHNGAIGNKGMLNLGKEIFQNSVDQILEGASSCKGFKFFYDERSLEVEVEDSGLGIPFDQLIRVFNTPNTSKNYEKKPFEYSTGLHGAGSKVVNALSSVFIVESYKYDGTAARVEFEKGYPKYDKYKPIPNKEKKQGLKVYFIPDLEIMGEITLEWKEYYRLIKMILAQTPIGTYCEFKAIDINGKTFTETIENKDGILTDLIMKVKHPIIKPIVVFEDNGYCKLHCAFCFDGGGESGPDDTEHVTAFSNFCETVGGTHIDGTIEGITRWFSNYMNNIYLSNQKAKDKLKVTSADIKNGLNVMISAAVLEAIFDGQSKNILSNAEMQGFCKEVVMKGLDQWAKSNPQDLAKISKFFKDMAELRTKAESSKAKIVTKYQANPLSGLPAKYIKPLGKEHLELLIVEGDSACGSATIARDKQTQGLFPIRGKIINAFRASKQAVFSNEEVQGITRIILGSDYKKGFSIEDCKVEKVIFMADGDVDGAHISALLLRLFIMYFPQMIEAGMVYKAIPPLYAIKQSGKMRYFTELVDYIRYVQRLFLDKYQLYDDHKKLLTSKEATVFFMKNADYVYHTERLANTYAINPNLLEMILYNYVENKDKIDVAKLTKQVKSTYRFMNVEKSGNITIVKGTIDKSNMAILGDKFFNDCSELIKIMKDNFSLHYIVNKDKMTIYQIMKLYEALSPSNLQRYKGLGEMDPVELGESTMLGNRTLIRYTLEDAKEELEAIREYESNPKKILNLVGNVTRDDLID